MYNRAAEAHGALVVWASTVHAGGCVQEEAEACTVGSPRSRCCFVARQVVCAMIAPVCLAPVCEFVVPDVCFRLSVPHMYVICVYLQDRMYRVYGYCSRLAAAVLRDASFRVESARWCAVVRQQVFLAVAVSSG